MGSLGESIRNVMPVPPVDVALARELVTLLNAEDTGRIKNIVFDYRPYIEFDEMPLQTKAWVTTNTMGRTRESRARFSKSCSIYIAMLVEQAENNDEQRIDHWLGAFDDLLDIVEELAPLGNPAVEIIQDQRFDRELLHQNKRLAMSAEILYNLMGE